MAESMTYSHALKIPKDRVAIVIGKSGEQKKEFETDFGLSLSVDSKEGEITIQGKESLKVYILTEVIRAIGRGFNPEIALKLKHQEFILEVINILDFVSNKNHMPRLRGRVIGTKGKSRSNLESLTDTNICVYGKTISIIGESSDVALARRAVESLLGGSPHSSVYRFLEKNRKEKRLI